MVSSNNGAENNGKAGKNNTFSIVVFGLGVGCLDWGLGFGDESLRLGLVFKNWGFGFRVAGKI